MNFIERIKFLGSLSFEKQFIIAVISVERSYREIVKVFPKWLEKKTIFKEALDLLWNCVRDKDLVNIKEIERINDELMNYVHDEVSLEPGEKAHVYNPIVTELARCINLSLAMITRGLGEKSGRTSANIAEGTRFIIATIYETLDGNREIGIKEKAWLAKTVYLVCESEEIPKYYEWFLEKNPDYERGKIYKNFRDVE